MHFAHQIINLTKPKFIFETANIGNEKTFRISRLKLYFHLRRTNLL